MRKISLFLLLCFNSACAKPEPQDACGFSQNIYRERISWKDKTPITFYLHNSVPEKFKESIIFAAEKWNSAINKRLIVISSVIDVGPFGASHNNKNVVYFYDEFWPHKDSVQGLTKKIFRGDIILDTDIIINGDTYQFFTLNEVSDFQKVNIESLMIHEFGHALGLAHTEIKPSVMYEYLPFDRIRVNIGQDSIDSLECEY